MSLRSELAKTKEIAEQKLSSQAQNNLSNEATITTLQKLLAEKDMELKSVRESQQSQERGKTSMLEELRQNNEDIKNVKREYKDEIERLSAMLQTLSLENEKWKDRLNEAETKVIKSEEIIDEYKKVIDSINSSKDNKMQELVETEIENERLKKLVDVSRDLSTNIERIRSRSSVIRRNPRIAARN